MEGVDAHDLRSLAPESINLRALIARGGFATCYKGVHKNQVVAVKVVPRLTSDSHTRYCFQSFLHECKLMQDMDHQNVVKCLGVVTLERRHFSSVKASTPAPLLAGGGFGLVQQFCNGGSIADLLLHEETSPFQKHASPQLALQWCKDICAALNYIHTLPTPVIHRDLKLDNVLLTDVAVAEGEGGEGGAPRGMKRSAMLADFGLGACITRGVARVATHVRTPVDLDLDTSLSYALEGAHEGSRIGHAPAEVSHHMSTVGSTAPASGLMQALATAAATGHSRKLSDGGGGSAAATDSAVSNTCTSVQATDSAASNTSTPLQAVDLADALTPGAAAAAADDVRGSHALVAMSEGGVMGAPASSIEDCGVTASMSLTGLDMSSLMPTPLAPIKEGRTREQSAMNLGHMDSLTSSITADDSFHVAVPAADAAAGLPMATFPPYPDVSTGAPPARTSTDDSGPLADMVRGNAAGRCAAGPATWARVDGGGAPPPPTRSRPSAQAHAPEAAQLLSAELMLSTRGSERPGQTSMMTSTSSACSVQLPVPPQQLSSSGGEAVSGSLSPGMPPPPAPPRPDIVPRSAQPSPSASPIPSPRQLLDSPRPALIEVPAPAATAHADGARPGPIAEGVVRDDDDAPENSWSLPQQSEDGIPAAQSGDAERGAASTAASTPTSSPTGSAACKTCEKPPSALPPVPPRSAPYRSSYGTPEGEQLSVPTAVAAHVCVDSEGAESPLGPPAPPRNDAAAVDAADEPGRARSAPEASLPLLSAARATALADKEPCSVRALHASVSQRQRVVNVYTVRAPPELAHTQSQGDAGPQSDRIMHDGKYPSLAAPLSVPNHTSHQEMEEEQLRNAHLKYKTYAHSTQRVVSVSQILPSNFLVPEGLGTFGAPVSPPDHPVGSPAAAAGDSPGTAARHSDDTQALYGSARDSADGHANAPALSSSTERSGGGAAALPAALAAGGSGVLRADGSSAAEPPRLHQVFSALAQKVAQVEQPPDALHRRSSSPVGDVTLQSTTDIVPQAWAQRKGHEALPPAALSERITLPRKNSTSSTSSSRLVRLARGASSIRRGLSASRRLLSRAGSSVSEPSRATLPMDAPPPDVYGSVRGERWKMTGETGSLIYMAPEVLHGKPYNAKVDIFSLGVIVYEVFGCQNISGRFDSEEQVVRFAREVSEGRRLAMPRRFPPALVTLIERLWQQAPRERPTAAEALALLDDFEASPDFAAMIGRSKSRGCLCF